jgi:hypothetical protein
MWHVWGRGDKHAGFRWGNLKRPFGRSSGIWEDNTKVGCKEIGLEGMDWIDMAKDRDK